MCRDGTELRRQSDAGETMQTMKARWEQGSLVSVNRVWRIPSVPIECGGFHPCGQEEGTHGTSSAGTGSFGGPVE